MRLSRRLTLDEATKIAESQFDLGLSSRQKMVYVLNGEDNDMRMKLYDTLDSYTRLIIDTFLDEDTIDEARVTFDYLIKNLAYAKNANK